MARGAPRRKGARGAAPAPALSLDDVGVDALTCVVAALCATDQDSVYAFSCVCKSANAACVESGLRRHRTSYCWALRSRRNMEFAEQAGLRLSHGLVYAALRLGASWFLKTDAVNDLRWPPAAVCDRLVRNAAKSGSKDCFDWAMGAQGTVPEGMLATNALAALEGAACSSVGFFQHVLLNTPGSFRAASSFRVIRAAASHRSTNMFRYLLDKGTAVQYDIAGRPSGTELWMSAAKGGSVEMINYLLQDGKYYGSATRFVAGKPPRNISQNSAFVMAAAHRGHCELLCRFAELGMRADSDAAHSAIERRRVEALHIVLERFNVKATPAMLTRAVEKACVGSVKVLLGKCVPPTRHHFFLACHSRSVPVLGALCSATRKPNALSKVYHYAVESQSLSCIRCLYAHGVPAPNNLFCYAKSLDCDLRVLDTLTLLGFEPLPQVARRMKRDRETNKQARALRDGLEKMRRLAETNSRV